MSEYLGFLQYSLHLFVSTQRPKESNKQTKQIATMKNFILTWPPFPILYSIYRLVGQNILFLFRYQTLLSYETLYHCSFEHCCRFLMNMCLKITKCVEEDNFALFSTSTQISAWICLSWQNDWGWLKVDEQDTEKHCPICHWKGNLSNYFIKINKFNYVIKFQDPLLCSRQVPLLHTTVLIFAIKERDWWPCLNFF